MEFFIHGFARVLFGCVHVYIRATKTFVSVHIYASHMQNTHAQLHFTMYYTIAWGCTTLTRFI